MVVEEYLILKMYYCDNFHHWSFYHAMSK